MLPNDASNLEKLSKYLNGGGSTAWIGKHPLPNTISISIRDSTLFRVHPENHGTFSTVFLIENGLNELGQGWEAYLDESLRLLLAKGIAVIKLRQTQDVNLINIKRFLGRSESTKVILIDQWTDQSNQTFLIISVERILWNEYNKKTWTFGIISDGKRMQNVTRSIERIQQFANNPEIIVVGPKFEFPNAKNIAFESGGLARISEKKNLLAFAAQNANLCILHDRYLLHPTFLQDWERFGYDFDFCGISQQTLAGAVYPSLVALPVKSEHWQMPVFTINGHYAEGNFINGGLFAIKTELLRKIQLNHLMLHNEAEDVELSWTLRYHGISTRMNLFASATTTHGESIGGYTQIQNPRVPAKLKRMIYFFALRFYSFLPSSLKNSSLVRNIGKKLKNVHLAG